MNEFWDQIANFGFPVVVSFYLLIRVEKKLDELAEAVAKLSNKRR